ncbi:anaphase-promoting complex subunit cdc27 [Clonorchis sinensis]|uniref:Cell division cycle protein 27 homolog n=1 Tax=Clonorchis sinensis TaxID=79923 RepID=A0A8T1MSR6_CLOSI|nr:anaphase-promoting complex subunit cdc27 [Clonorchis sinensis]
MVQEVSIISDPVMLHVWSCLHNYAYEDALFAAERLYAETRSSESLYLLATSLYRIGRPKQVSRLLTSTESLTPKSRYLLAKCYFDFGLLSEAEDALLGHTLSPKSVDEVAQLYDDQAGFAILLLGDICRRQGRAHDASKCYKKCLELNPMMWSAFKRLCDIGESPNPLSCFQARDGLAFPTPTFQVVHQALDLGVTQAEHRTWADQAAAEKSRLEGILYRENVNPEKGYDVPIPTGNAHHPKPPDSIDTSGHRRTYVTHCAKDSKDDTSTQCVNLFQTPQERLPYPTVPKAPKPEHAARCFVQSLFSGQGSSLEITNPVSPKFGQLALLSQSPLFACVPVFHKLPANPPCDSVLSNSTRFGTNQTATIRTDVQNESSIAPTHNTRTALHGSSASTTTRRRSKTGDLETTKLPASSHASSLGPTNKAYLGMHSNSEQTTSTPTSAATALRRLIFSPSTTFAANSSSTSPNLRCEPPVLRSTTQDSVPSGCSVLTPRAGLPVINLNSPIGGFGGSSSTPRPGPAQHTPRRASSNQSFPDESQPTGPRTRSQVAAAAAVARASGLHKRPDKLVRSKDVPRKQEGRTCSHTAVTSTLIDHQTGASSDLMEGLQLSESPGADESHPMSFGSDSQSGGVITLDILAPTSSDIRVTSLQKYLKLLGHLGKAYQLLVRHDWSGATRLISRLPIAQLATGRILAWAARAHMDNTDYTKAKQLFSEAHRLEPWQLVGMDFYSTVLWQLQADHELSNLAHELMELDHNAPEPWSAAGNCFSLQGEHEIAIRFFQRAIQVCPTNAYTYTLLGHEQSTLEEFDRALTAFRHALRLDPRQYNAMFGIGNVYYKQEKFELAETHLARAVALFPHSHLLLTNLGVLRGRLGHLDDGPESALALVTKACQIQPNNPLARYHRSSLLFHLGRYPEVLTELQKLLVLCPREAMVYLMIGHTYKKLGNTPQAMIHYSWAMGLDPKGANTHLRDIMTNPPVTGRTFSRRGVNSSDTLGVENGGAAGPSRTTRSRLAPLPDSAQPGGDLPEDSTDRGFPETDHSVEDEPMNGLFNFGSGSSRGRSGRRLTDFSLLYDAEEYGEDALLSGAEEREDHYETMDLSGGVEEDSGTSLVDD